MAAYDIRAHANRELSDLEVKLIGLLMEASNHIRGEWGPESAIYINDELAKIGIIGWRLIGDHSAESAAAV